MGWYCTGVAVDGSRPGHQQGEEKCGEGGYTGGRRAKGRETGAKGVGGVCPGKKSIQSDQDNVFV